MIKLNNNKMLAAIKIKKEPLDDNEDLQEIFKKEPSSVKQQITDVVPVGCSLPSDNLHIVEEKERIITVSAADMRSKDEVKFIDSINNSDPNQFKGICSKCLKIFTNRGQFLKHTKRNHCVTKQKCPVCPVTFIDAVSLLNHLNKHRENFFFCSQHCGSNFATLALCEEHELKEHKVQSVQKIRFKYFCSFCREGFKTELQLHVHWLQQTYGCGKHMQDVVLHSTNVAQNYNPNSKNTKNLSLDKQLPASTNNSVSIIPITKLRLKSTATTTTSPPVLINKRPTITNGSDNDETFSKRLKIKAEIETNQLPCNFESDIKIKDEPLDDYESNLTTNLVPEVIIKTEEEEEEVAVNSKPQMQSLIINNMIGPQSSGKFIPLETFVSTENKKTELKSEMKSFSINNLVNTNVNNKTVYMNNLPVLKLVNNNNNNISNNGTKDGNLRLIKILPAPKPVSNTPLNNFSFSNLRNCSTGKLMSLKLANGQTLLSNKELKPLNKHGMHIIKLLPNSQIISMKPNTNNNLSSQLSPLLVESQSTSAQMSPETVSSSAPTLIQKETITETKACLTTKPTTTTISSDVTVKLDCLNKNTTIDTEDFRKLQVQALIQAEEQRKNFYIPKTRLMIIENIPEKKQLIETMKQQIAEVETKTTEQIQSKPRGNFVLNTMKTDEPASFYLPILTTLDIVLVEARYKNPQYSYKFICPYCQKDYEIKTALKGHLSRAHNLNTRDMEKINVLAKPYFVNEDEQKVIIEEDIKPQIKEEFLSEDSNSLPPLVISEYEPLVNTNTNTTSSSSSVSPKPIKAANTKSQRARYVCNKCGRTCSSKTMLNDHILANCSRVPQYACKECDKKFFSHGTLQCHMTIHTGELPHKCNYCDKRFRTRGQVKVHHRTHTGERPFFCQVCSQRFTHRETLIAHLSRHIGMKRYKCYGCDKHFSCISALKTHREIRADTCGKVKFNPRAIGPRVRVIRGNVIFEPQPEINPYLKSEDPKSVLSELQNQAHSETQSPL